MTHPNGTYVWIMWAVNNASFDAQPSVSKKQNSYKLCLDIFLKIIFIGVKLFYKVVLASYVQQSESAICIIYSFTLELPSHLILIPQF